MANKVNKKTEVKTYYSRSARNQFSVEGGEVRKGDDQGCYSVPAPEGLPGDAVYTGSYFKPLPTGGAG